MPGYLFDADAAKVSDLTSRRRAKTTVGDADAHFRAELITEYVAARGDWTKQLSLLAAAARYDKAHPDEPVRLADEMYGTGLGEAA